jgi:hypothetical protein
MAFKSTTSRFANLSPVGWEHLNLTGDYMWQTTRRLAQGTFRLLGRSRQHTCDCSALA